MAAETQRIVVQATTQDKKAIATKAKRFDIAISELMRRGAFAYDADDSDDSDAQLGALADAAEGAADRAGAAIDDALSLIDASDKRIAAMEAKAHRAPSKGDEPDLGTGYNA